MWKFAGATTGDKFEIEDMNIWAYEWTQIPNLNANVKDPFYDTTHDLPVYQIRSGSRFIYFAAREFSNCVWGVFVPTEQLKIPSEVSMIESRIKQFDGFWLFYVCEHAHPLNRQLHFIGSSLGLVCLALLCYTGNLFFFPLGLVMGYGFAWAGHFFVEQNKPASFSYPLWSLRSDWKMWALMLTGRMRPEIARAVRTA